MEFPINPMSRQVVKHWFTFLWLPWLLVFWPSLNQGAVPLDRIVAVAEDDVILESDLEQRLRALEHQITTSGAQLPPRDILRRQILERMILHSLQLQLARKHGIQVDDETLRQSLLELAQGNHMDLDTFRQAIENEGMNYPEFVENLRQEIMLNRLRASQINSQIQVTDREINHFLETEAKGGGAIQYRLGHILVATPEAASPKEIQKAQRKAQRIYKELEQGLDFHQAAMSASDGAQALKGGDLGWRKLGEIPTLFAEIVPKMKKGEIHAPIRSPSGFHIIKLVDIQGADKHIVTEIHARHILIKTNEIIDDEEAQRRLRLIKQRIEKGEDFAELARAFSDDQATSVKGGDLGWITPDVVVPAFAKAMEQLQVNQISEPVQTPFGWHLIQVLGRKTRDDTLEFRKKRAREVLMRRKAEEETELWLRKLRNESYVEIHLDE